MLQNIAKYSPYSLIKKKLAKISVSINKNKYKNVGRNQIKGNHYKSIEII